MEFIKSKERLLQNFIGKSIFELPTPSIVADIEEVDANLTRMDDFFTGSRCKLRPHFKSHKCVTLAKRQMSHKNTVGITCAKCSEAEQLVGGGINDILIANQVIGLDKADRIAEMNHKANVRVAVDSRLGIEQLSIAAKRAGVQIGLLIEIDIGMNRGGVQADKSVVNLADFITTKEGLRFDGLQSYEGHIVTLPDYDERKKRVEEDIRPLLETREILEQHGFSVIISSGGTGTYDITGNIAGIDELQCGSYALMDSAYKKIRPEFLNARYILTTIISKRDNVFSTDVGLKGMGAEYGDPMIVDYPNVEHLYVAEEHTVFKNGEFNIGEKIRIIPPHGCTTNNFYAHMWISRKNLIEDIWAVEGRGCLE